MTTKHTTHNLSHDGFTSCGLDAASVCTGDLVDCLDCLRAELKDFATTKHTPGPWIVMDGQACFTVYGPNGHIATIAPTEEREQEKANARLIAAAPELLEALRCGMYVMLAQSKHLTGNLKRQAEVCAKSWDELITKAEGRD